VAVIAAGAALMTLGDVREGPAQGRLRALPRASRARAEVPAPMYVPVLALVALCLLSGLLWPVVSTA